MATGCKQALIYRTICRVVSATILPLQIWFPMPQPRNSPLCVLYLTPVLGMPPLPRVTQLDLNQFHRMSGDDKNKSSALLVLSCSAQALFTTAFLRLGDHPSSVRAQSKRLVGELSDQGGGLHSGPQPQLILLFPQGPGGAVGDGKELLKELDKMQFKVWRVSEG